MVKKRHSRIFSMAAMEKILKKAGIGRVSDDAKFFLCSVLEDMARNIAKNAIKFAEHAGRRTIKREDINLASK